MYIEYSGNIEKKKVELADSHLCQCIVGTYTLIKIPYSTRNGITYNTSSKNNLSTCKLQLASLKTAIIIMFLNILLMMWLHCAWHFALFQEYFGTHYDHL